MNSTELLKEISVKTRALNGVRLNTDEYLRQLSGLYMDLLDAVTALHNEVKRDA